MRNILLWTLILTLCGFLIACEKEAPSGPGAMEPIQPRGRVHDKNALAQVQLPTWPPLGSAGVDLAKLPRSYRRGMALLAADPNNLAMAEAAQQHALALLKITADRPLGHVLQARLQLALGRKPNGQILDGNLAIAVQHFSAALEADPKCYEAIFYQADLDLKTKHMARYDALVKRARALRPNSPETRWLALRQKSRLISWTDWLHEAETLLADARHPDLLRQTYSLVAQNYRLRDNTAKALAIHQAMVDRLPEDPRAITLFIECLLTERMPSQALELTEQLERLRPGPTTVRLKAKILCNKGKQLLGRKTNLEEAEAWYRKAIKLEPEQAEAWLGLALALHMRAKESESEQDQTRAFQAASKAKQLDPGNRQARSLYEELFYARHP